MDIAQNAIMPEMSDKDDLEVWAYYKAKKLLIAQSGGVGKIEFRFHNPNSSGMRLITKGYFVAQGKCNIALEMSDKDDQDAWDFYRSKKPLIKREGGHGGFEFRFRDLNKNEIKLVEKNYYVTHKACIKLKPSKRPSYIAPSSNYDK